MSYYLTRPAEVLSQTLIMDTNVLQAAIESGVGRYFYASSSHVYPLELELTPDAPPLREEQAFPANPALSYGWAKLIAENHQLIHVIQYYVSSLLILNDLILLLC